MLNLRVAAVVALCIVNSTGISATEKEDSAYRMKSFLAYFSEFSDKCKDKGPNQKLLDQLNSRVEQQGTTLPLSKRKAAEVEGRKLAQAQLGKTLKLEEQCARSQRGFLNLYNVVEGLSSKKWKKT